MRSLLTSVLILISIGLFSQNYNLKEIEILGRKNSIEIKSENEGVRILEGKKNETIILSNSVSNKATNNVRQIMSKIAGLNIWELDGSGIQVGVSTRGLSPNRSWEFNTRQNGYDMSADVFGYPEAYYNPPMEAVERIEFIRGSSALQYGPQFGGVLNYILKRDKSDKPFNFEGNLTAGSYGLAGLYTAVGGNTKKWNYYFYNQMRKADGWRENGYYDTRNTHGFIHYKINEASSISAEYTNSNYLLQQSGGLTDLEYNANPSRSFRSRNWFSTPWQLANIKYENKIDSNFRIQISATALWGERSSVGYLAPANKLDTINLSTNQYNAKQVDRDFYRNLGIEWRNLWNYKLGHQKQDLAFGMRAYMAHTDRNQKGKGSTGDNYDVSVANLYPTSLDFNTKNMSIYAENTFRFGNKFSISPGLRYEWIQSEMTGRFNIVNNSEIQVVPSEKTRTKLLAGLSLQYKFNENSNLYGSATQAFRPVLFSDLTPPATTDVIDPNLKDASGWNIDLGVRGNIDQKLHYDFSAFYLIYNDRIGTVRLFPNNDPTKSSYQFRTNLGQTINKGIEAYAELDLSPWIKKDKGFGHLSIYSTASFIHATYQDFKTYSISGTAPNQKIEEKNLSGNKVEYVPTWMLNLGLNYRYKRVSIHAQGRTISEVYTDATNTVTPNPEATTGKLDGYKVLDISAEYKLNGHYTIGAGINNFSNEKYSTRRSGGYPGPGILPSEGRTWYFSFGVKM